MGIFNFKKEKTVDFTKMSNPSKGIVRKNDSFKFDGDSVDLRNADLTSVSNSFENSQEIQQESAQESNNFDFLNTMASSSSSSTSSVNPVTQVSEMSEIRTNMRKLSSQVEDFSNENYRLLQRIELLERKLERFEGRGI